MTETVLMIGTRKGLWVGTQLPIARPGLSMDRTNRSTRSIPCAIDTRGDQPRLLMGSRSWHWGTQVLHSDDLGETWQRGGDPAIRFPEDTGTSLEAVWSLAASPAEPGVVWAGTEPSALWKSADGGRSFELVRGLWDHPHRPQWAPGGGGQAIHTLLPHPTDPRRSRWRCRPAVSTAATTAARPGSPRNQGIKVEFAPGGRRSSRPGGSASTRRSATPRTPTGSTPRTTAASTAPTTPATAGPPSPTACPSDFGFPVVAHPHRARHHLRLPARSEPESASRSTAGPGSTGPRTPARRGRSSARGFLTASTPR